MRCCGVHCNPNRQEASVRFLIPAAGESFFSTTDRYSIKALRTVDRKLHRGDIQCRGGIQVRTRGLETLDDPDLAQNISISVLHPNTTNWIEKVEKPHPPSGVGRASARAACKIFAPALGLMEESRLSLIAPHSSPIFLFFGPGQSRSRLCHKSHLLLPGSLPHCTTPRERPGTTRHCQLTTTKDRSAACDLDAGS